MDGLNTETRALRPNGYGSAVCVTARRSHTLDCYHTTLRFVTFQECTLSKPTEPTPRHHMKADKFRGSVRNNQGAETLARCERYGWRHTSPSHPPTSSSVPPLPRPPPPQKHPLPISTTRGGFRWCSLEDGVSSCASSVCANATSLPLLLHWVRHQTATGRSAPRRTPRKIHKRKQLLLQLFQLCSLLTTSSRPPARRLFFCLIHRTAPSPTDLCCHP